MEIEDPVYGDAVIEEEVLKELIQSEPVQRLKEISMSGPLPFFTDKKLVSRYEHSIGVMVLLRKHGASIEEQIAGLLHDTPHTAFSHTIDYVYQTENYDYHDDFLEEIVYGSEIPEILERHGLDTEDILDESRFGLLERDAPLICADRIDYFLRDSKLVLDEEVDRLSDSLTTHDGRFVLDDKDVAEEYALRFIDADRRLWANPEEIAVNELFADAIRRALREDVVTEDDLFRNDRFVMEKLENSDIAFIHERFQAIREKDFEVGAEEPDLVGRTKARYVDPPVLVGGELVRVSDYSEKLSKEITRHKQEVNEGFPIKIS